MPLREELNRQGGWLFKRRSFVPLLFVFIIALTLPYLDFQNHNQQAERLWEIFCFVVSLLGLAIRIYTAGFAHKGTSGTITKKQSAENLNTSGIYSLVRNPLYLGNYFMWLGISLLFNMWWLSLIVTLVFWLCYERIIFTEEEFLREKFGEAYLAWAEKTPAFIPNFKHWQRPERSFARKRVIRNEYKSFVSLVVTFYIIKLLKDFAFEHQLKIDVMWTLIFIAAVVFFLVIRVLKMIKII